MKLIKIKHKIAIITLTSLLFIGFLAPVLAIDFGNIIGLKSDIGDEITKDINEKIDDITVDLKEEIKNYKDKITAEEKKIRGMVSEVEAYVKQVHALKANAAKYIMIAKIIIAVLSGGIIILLFFIWRIWRNIVNMKKAFKAVVNYDQIQKRIEILEKQTQELQLAQK